MRIFGGDGEIYIKLTVQESKELIVDHGENELIIPSVDTLKCLKDLRMARREAEDDIYKEIDI